MVQGSINVPRGAVAAAPLVVEAAVAVLLLVPDVGLCVCVCEGVHREQSLPPVDKEKVRRVAKTGGVRFGREDGQIRREKMERT